MKRFLTTAAVFATLLTACGDDTSSNAGNGSSRPTGDDVFSRAGTLYVNESEHILAIALENYETQMCVVEEDNYTWKTVHINNEPDSMMYEFRGDTLLLYDIYHGLPDTDYGEMLVGGTAGSLYGTWTYTGCEYDKEEDETECHEKSLRYYHRSITFSKGKAEINYKVYFDRYVEDHSDFMNSYFMSQLFNTLGGNYPEIYLDEIWYMEASSVQATAQKIEDQVERHLRTGRQDIYRQRKTYGHEPEPRRLFYRKREQGNPSGSERRHNNLYGRVHLPLHERRLLQGRIQGQPPHG